MSSLEEVLKERLHTKRLDRQHASVSGGCISKGYCYKTDNDENIFVKTNASQHAVVMFEGEIESLKQISFTKTVRVPKPLLVVHEYDDTQGSAIAMEFLDMRPLTDGCAKSIGQELANLHDYNNKVRRFKRRATKWIGGLPPSVKAVMKAKDEQKDDNTSNEGLEDDEEEANPFAKHSLRVKNVEKPAEPAPTGECPVRFVPEPNTEEITQFGFNIPTSCGLLPQINDWTNDWVAFYARHRLDVVIRTLLSDHGDRELSQQWSQLQLKVDKFFSDYDPRGSDDDKIVPALLHGDLWSGNVAQLSDGSRGVVYDPCSFYGHSEYDFGIARMFGGIPKALEEAYFELMPKKKLFEKRNKLYQLFHHLNHWNHFGSGYRPGSLRLMKDLNSMIQ